MHISEIEGLIKKYRNVKDERIFNYEQMFESYSAYAKHISTRKARLGMRTLDNLLGLIRPSQLVTIIGATNVGKTVIAMHIGYHNSVEMNDKLIIMFNLEIDENEILERTLCTEFDITSYEVENAFLKEDTHRFKSVIDKYNNFVSVIGRVDIYDVIPYVKAIEETYGKPAGLVIIDYLQLLKNRNIRERNERIADNAEKLKEVALHLQIPVIDISQTSRADVKNNDKGLGLYSAKGSGEVENSSQIVIVINKIPNKEKAMERGINNNVIEAIENGEIYLLEAKIEKKKQGSFGECFLVQQRRNLRICELDDYQIDKPF